MLLIREALMKKGYYFALVQFVRCKSHIICILHGLLNIRELCSDISLLLCGFATFDQLQHRNSKRNK